MLLLKVDFPRQPILPKNELLISASKIHKSNQKAIFGTLKTKKSLDQLSLKDYQKFYKGFTADVRESIKLEKAVNSRKHIGGTATAAVMRRIKEIENNSGKK